MRRRSLSVLAGCLLLPASLVSAEELTCAELQQLLADGVKLSFQQDQQTQKTPAEQYAENVPPEAEETLLLTVLKLVRKGYNLQQLGAAFEATTDAERIGLVMAPLFQCGKTPEAPVSEVLAPEVEKLVQKKLGIKGPSN